jgi:hypothetical protein
MTDADIDEVYEAIVEALAQEPPSRRAAEWPSSRTGG